MRVRGSTGSSGRSTSPWALWIAVMAVAGLLLAACGEDVTDDVAEPDAPDDADPADDDADPADDDADPAAAEDWPDDTVRILVGAAEGGGLDTAARLMQGPLSDRLGVDVVVENHEGAQTAIANQIAYQEGDECDVMVFNNFPIFLFSYHLQDVDYTYDDVYPVAAVQAQPSVIVVPIDSPHETIDDLIEEIRSRPGEISASVSALASTNAVGLMQMEDVLDLDINIIDFDGGAPARQAVISGEVDFSHTSVFAAMSLLGEELRMLAAHQTEEDWEPFREIDVLADVPTLREATGEDAFGSNTASYGITVNRTCHDNHPERYERLVEASYDVMESDEFIAQLEELDLELSTMSHIPPDEYHEMLEAERQEVDRLAADLFE